MKTPPALRPIPASLRPRRLSLSTPFRRHSLHHERPKGETARFFAERAHAYPSPPKHSGALAPKHEQVIRLPRFLRLLPTAASGLSDESRPTRLFEAPSQPLSPLAGGAVVLLSILGARDFRDHLTMSTATLSQHGDTERETEPLN